MFGGKPTFCVYTSMSADVVAADLTHTRRRGAEFLRVRDKSEPMRQRQRADRRRSRSSSGSSRTGHHRRSGFDTMEPRRLLAGTITIEFNDSYDTSGFFAANPQAMTVVQEAGQILGGQLENSLAAITPAGGNTWSQYIGNPSDPATNLSFTNSNIPANTIVVYVGCDPGISLYQTFLPGYSASGSSSWEDSITSRGQTAELAGSAPTIGSISFSTGTDWSFGGTTSPPGANQYDFLTATLQALGSILGIGTSASWQADVDPITNAFIGAHAEAAYGGPVPLSTNDYDWATDLESAGAEPVMDGQLNIGQERALTPLDWAGLDDIGWTTDQLVVTAQPPALVTVGAGFGLSVTAEDPDGQIDALFGGPVTMVPGNNSGGAAIAGTLTATADDGVAAFTGLSINQLGASYTLVASSGDLPSATITTGAFNVTPIGQATQLAVTVQPLPTVSAGTGIDLTITAEDGFDHPDASFDGEVTLILAANPGDGTLGGGFSMTAGNGVATFSNVTIDSAGVGYVLAASGTDLVARMTAPFNVAAEQATQLVVTTEPAPDDLAHNPFAVVVSAEDAFGNVDPTFSGLVTLTPGNNPAAPPSVAFSP